MQSGSWHVSRCSGCTWTSPACFSFLSEVGRRRSPDSESGKGGISGVEKSVRCKHHLEKQGSEWRALCGMLAWQR